VSKVGAVTVAVPVLMVNALVEALFEKVFVPAPLKTTFGSEL
jgi:hypothetical protein